MSCLASSQVSTTQILMSAPVDISLRKRPLPQEIGNEQSSDCDEACGKRSCHDAVSNSPQVFAPPAILDGTASVMAIDVVYGSHSVAPIISAFATLLAQGERGTTSVQILIESLTTDILAEIVIANMVQLPSTLSMYSPNANPAANWGHCLPGPADIAASSLSNALTESTAAFEPYMSSADTSRDSRKVLVL